jgi:hypothetical protein
MFHRHTRRPSGFRCTFVRRHQSNIHFVEVESMNPTFPILDDQNGILTVTNLVDANGNNLTGPLPAVINAASTNSSQLSVTPVAGSSTQFLVQSGQAVGAPITESIILTGTDPTTGASLSTQVDFNITHDTPANPPVGFAVTFGQVQKNT